MKIGLLTFHFSDNYGALLQAYCLQEYLRSLGHQTEFINYHPYYVEQGGSLTELLRPALTRTYLKKLYLFWIYKRQRIFSSSGHAAQLDFFREQNLTVSSHLARTYDQLEPYLSYDQIVIGSDQVWNPSDQYGPDPVYFGYPFSNRITTSSYAASFGSISRIESCFHNILPWIQSLQQCSVREGEARDFLCAHDVDCVLVPDPTLLVDDLKAFMVSPSDIDLSSSIFVYALRSQDGVRDIVSLLSSQLGLTPISASTPWRRWKRIGREIDLDPFTFLGSIAASKLVVSNSFHGIVCSVLLRKEFIAVSLPGSKAGFSSRIRSFLNAVGLENRILSSADLSQVLNLANSRIDWSSVNESVLSLQQQGRFFLRSMLNHSA